jgi:subtilisin-like proprotein convertase family protein
MLFYIFMKIKIFGLMKCLVQPLKFAFLVIILAFGIHQGHSQNSNYWEKIVSPYIQKQTNPTSIKNYETYQLDYNLLKEELKFVPFRFSGQKSTSVIQMPSLSGDVESFTIYQTQVISPVLANKFPSIKTYVGVSKVNPNTKLNLSITPKGIYAMLINGGQTLFINPFVNDELYVVFDKKQAVQDLMSAMVCEVEEIQNQLIPNFTSNTIPEFVDDASLKRYRLALACSSSYSEFHLAQANTPENATIEEKQEVVLAAMVVTINRVNFIYERDVAVTLQLVGNNEELIQLDPLTDPYDDTGNDINVNQGQIDSTIGNSSYDIGHIFNTGGGGAASFQSVCNNQFKAAAYTGLPNPVGDPFDVDYVAHEIGHQFGGSHTFNNECGGARSETTAVEPGSGSTIMAYAGICPQNIQNNSDAYFHVVSVFQMHNYISQNLGFTCAESISINNNAPTIDEALQDYTIPVNTPFYLDVTASDMDDDELTYTWEQLDNEVDSPQPPLAFNFGGPNFRSISPSTNSTRYFPNLNSVVNNVNETWEVLPGIPRDMEFSVLVRDNNVEAGQSAFDDTSITFINGLAFEVTSQSESNLVWEAGETQTISWEVANTNQAPVNSSEVDILLSTNAGQDFDIVLASNVPNTGSAEIIVPDVFGPSCRLMVRSSDNIFFNVNSTSFSIDSGVQLECEEVANTTVASIPEGEAPNTPGPALNSIITIDESLIIESISVSVDITHTYIQDLGVEIIGPDNQVVTLFNRNCSSENGIAAEFDDFASPIPDNCSDPLTGVYQPSLGQLNQWLGTNAQGEWTLRIQDFWNEDTGELNSWSLEVCASSLSINTVEANRFSIVPNPNQGQFQINLNSLNSSNPTGELYDLQGKLVQKIQLKPGMLRQTVFLESLQNGMYLFKINDGQNSYVEKLLIR